MKYAADFRELARNALRGLPTVDHAHISCDIRRPYGWILVFVDLRRMNLFCR